MKSLQLRLNFVSKKSKIELGDGRDPYFQTFKLPTNPSNCSIPLFSDERGRFSSLFNSHVCSFFNLVLLHPHPRPSSSSTRTDMATELIMMCQHDGKFAAIRMNRGHDFSTVIRKICARWSDLDPDSVVLNYSLKDTEHIILDNDDDLTTMFQNAELAGIDDFMITVRDGAKCCDGTQEL